jgi:hypothetical protein
VQRSDSIDGIQETRYKSTRLKFIEPDSARLFGNGMREYALSIGKKSFFTFGEVPLMC